MSWIKNIASYVLVILVVLLGSTNVFALNAGETSSVDDMQLKLSREGQVEVANAATGTKQSLRGIKIYFNPRSKTGYIVLTDDPIRPSQMRVLLVTNSTDFAGPIMVPQPLAGIEECRQLISQSRVNAKDCGSLYSVLKVSQDKGFNFYQQGVLASGNKLIIVVNRANGEGIVYESTPNGATTTKLALGNLKIR